MLTVKRLAKIKGKIHQNDTTILTLTKHTNIGKEKVRSNTI